MKFYLMAMAAMLMFASSSALAQQARRNASVEERKEAQAERKQEKVNEAQKPANVANQSATDARLRASSGSLGNGRDDSRGSSGAADSRSSGGSSYGSGSGSYSGSGSGSGSGYGSGSGGKDAGGKGSGGNGKGPGGKDAGGKGSSGYGSGGSGKAPGGSGSGHGGGYGNGGGYGSGHGSGYGNGGGYGSGSTYPGGYGDRYPGFRPPMPSSRSYSRSEVLNRTNASSIVLRTRFRSVEEAYRYVERLLLDSSYIVGSYGNGYSWLMSDVSFIPTPYDWANPMTHNQFRIKVNFYRSFGYVRAVISGDWRESVISSLFSTLRFQPSSSYSTYYAWCVLEDLADSIPHDSISYR